MFPLFLERATPIARGKNFRNGVIVNTNRVKRFHAY